MDANTVAINFVWTLVAGFLVMFMQAGFALVETGFTRAKNAAHTMTMNFMVYGIAMLAYWAVGFALQAGGVGPLGTLGGYDQLSHEVAVTIGGRRGACSEEPGSSLPASPTPRRSSPTSCSRWCSWTLRPRSRRERWPSGGDSSRSLSSACSSVHSFIRSTPTGLGAGAGSPCSARTSGWATATSTSRDRPWCT